MNRDKKSFVLVCKEFSIVGTPVLYKHMVLHVDALEKENLVLTSLAANNLPSLAHIRTIHVRDDHYDGKWGWKSYRAIRKTCRLLSALPDNILTWFEYVYSIRLADHVLTGCR